VATAQRPTQSAVSTHHVLQRNGESFWARSGTGCLRILKPSMYSTTGQHAGGLRHASGTGVRPYLSGRQSKTEAVGIEWTICSGRHPSEALASELRSGPFGWLPAHDPVAIRCGNDNLTHSVVGIFGGSAGRPTRSKFGIQAVDIIDLQIAEPVVSAKHTRVHVFRALAQHYPDSVPLGQSPIRCILPADSKAQDLAEIPSALIDVRDSEHEGPRGHVRLHSGFLQID